MAKLVSIIYSTKGRHNGLLLDSLSTILYQTYQSWELIVVKDSAFDFEANCRFLYQHCKDKIKVIDAPDNCGIGVARNIGLKYARGSYIAYLDDDDLWSENYLEKQVLSLESSDADLVYCNYHLRTQLYNEIEKKYTQHFIAIPYNVNPFDRKVLLTEPFIHTSSVIHTKDIIELISFPEMRSFGDWKFFLQASKIFRFHSNPETLATIQRRLDSTNSRTEYANESIRNLKSIIDEYDKEIVDDDTRKIRDMIFESYKEDNLTKSKKEAAKLEVLLYNRGHEFANGYLKMLLDRKELSSDICRTAQKISLLDNKELAKDFEFLSHWFDGSESDKFANYIPTYFERKNEQWIALL